MLVKILYSICEIKNIRDMVQLVIKNTPLGSLRKRVNFLFAFEAQNIF
jgi:hypothetical protein